MNTYSFKIKDLFIKPSFSGFTNFVSRVSWQYVATNEIGVEGSHYGSNQFTGHTGNTYVDFSALTENEVIEWVESTQDIVKLKQKVDKTIENKMKFPTQKVPIPWS
jgi:hypothetical protein